MQHIGFNLLYLVPRETGGTETYARELIPRIVAARPDLRYTAFVNREAYASFTEQPWAARAQIELIPVSGNSRVMRVAAEQSLLPYRSKRARVDVMHSLATTSPAKIGAASVVTIHDMIYKHHPEAHGALFSLGMGVLVPLSARRSDRVIADSQMAAEDLIRITGIGKEKVDVIHLGIGSIGARYSAVDENELRRRMQLGPAPIILTLSAKRQHKNLMRLLEAFARLRLAYAPILVMPGYSTAHERELKDRAVELGISERVKFFTWIDGAELEGLYKAARCFVFPSLLEGFGLPVLEAMSRDLPVACSSAPPLPEIAGNAALFFDPFDVSAITKAIERLLQDDKKSDQLIKLGREQAKRFSWDQAASKTIVAYEKAFAQHHKR